MRTFRLSAKEPPKVATSGDKLMEDWYRERHNKEANIRDRRNRSRHYQDQIDEQNNARRLFYEANSLLLEHQQAERDRERAEAAAKAAADIAAAAAEADLKAEQVKQILSSNRIKAWYRKKKFQGTVNEKAELRKEVPKGVDYRTYKYIMEKAMTFDDEELKVWVEKITNKVIEIEDKQNQFFTNVGNAEKEAEKQGQGKTILGVQIGGVQIGGQGQTPAKLITPELTSPQKGPVTRERKKQLLQEGDDAVGQLEFKG